jgi:hypothetical protein
MEFQVPHGGIAGSHQGIAVPHCGIADSPLWHCRFSVMGLQIFCYGIVDFPSWDCRFPIVELQVFPTVELQIPYYRIAYDHDIIMV